MTSLGRIFIIIIAIPIVLAIIGVIYQFTATAIDQRNYPPPGQLVDVGGYRLHIYCTGSGGPTVILDSLFPGGVANWAWIQPEIARVTRVCSYDRAGLGWSDSGPEPRDAETHTRELHALLANAEVPGPYILVGHSLGGLSAQMFAELYPMEVAGMVLIEGTNPDAWRRLGKPEGVGVDRNMLAAAPFIANLGVFRLNLIPSYAADADLPERQQKELQSFFSSTQSFKTILAVDSAFSAALEQVRQTGKLGDKPLVIVLGSKGDGGEEKLRDLFIQQAGLSSNSVTHLIDGATHASLVDKKEHASQTSAAIIEVVDAVRTGQKLISNRP